MIKSAKSLSEWAFSAISMYLSSSTISIGIFSFSNASEYSVNTNASDVYKRQGLGQLLKR